MIDIDFGWRSVFHYGEELCGDKVETARVGGFIGVLADGMGSGVKANILSTMSAKILTTMLSQGSTVAETVETVISTLPVCSERGMNYCTFSVVRIDEDGAAKFVEFDNPTAWIIRNGQLMQLERVFRPVADKAIFESELQLVEGDWVVITSDGAVNAGTENQFSYRWTWQSVADWLCRNVEKCTSAVRLAYLLTDAVNNLYGGKPTDDVTAMVIRIPAENTVSLIYGPPADPADDERMVREFLDAKGTRIVCGGTTAKIVSRVTGEEVFSLPPEDGVENALPPLSFMDGVDLVTEGVLTMTAAWKLVEDYFTAGYSYADFEKLDAENGAAIIAKQLLEDCSLLRVFIGTARNEAYDKADIPLDLTAKIKCIEGICDALEKHGRRVERHYF